MNWRFLALSAALIALAIADVDPCKRQPFRGRCPSVNGAPLMRSQFVLRYYLRGTECVSYPYGHCANDDNEPKLFRYKEECEDICIKHLDQTSAPGPDTPASTAVASNSAETDSNSIAGNLKTETDGNPEEVESDTQAPQSSGEFTYAIAAVPAEGATVTSDNYQVPKTECQRQRDNGGSGGGLIKGGFVPECAANGEFRQLQCEQDKSECFCVNVDGIEVDNSRVKNDRPDCQKIISASPQRTNECVGGSDAGPCKSDIQRWFYDESAQTCKQFGYSGCGGNGNNYQTEAACKKRCVPTTEAATCHRGMSPLKTGQGKLVNCAKTDCPAGYKCSVSGSTSVCCPDVEKSVVGVLHSGVSAHACQMPKERGPCDRYELRFYYSQELKECKYFFYGGCEGNENNFARVEDCEVTCGAPKKSKDLPATDAKISEKVTRPVSTPTSSTTTVSTTTTPPTTPRQTTQAEPQTFGPPIGRPEEFEPVRTRPPTTTAPLAGERCLHPQDTGSCGGQFVRWMWNSNDRKCQSFTYTGCGGNGNNFASQEECLSICHLEVVNSEIVPDITNVCDAEMEVGECTGSFMRYAFDKTRGDCRQFQYGGCGGNGNNFATVSDCRKKCVPSKGNPENFLPQQPSPPGEPTFGAPNVPELPSATIASNIINVDMQVTPSINVCDHPIEIGECSGVFQRFAYDGESNECRAFEYGGCGGNGNNFATLPECRGTCVRTRCPPPPQCDTNRCQVVNDNRGCPFCSCPPSPQHPPINPRFEQPNCAPLDLSLCVEPCIIFSNRRGCKECVCPVAPSQLPPQEQLPSLPRPQQPLAPPPPPSPEVSMPRQTIRPAPPGPARAPSPPSAPAPPARQIFTNEIVQPAIRGVQNVVPTKVPPPPTGQTSHPRATIADLGEKCNQGVDPGPCKNFIERWHFNGDRGECEPFQYGGCAGNRNHFFSRRECEIHCARFSRVPQRESSEEVFFQPAPTVPQTRATQPPRVVQTRPPPPPPQPRVTVTRPPPTVAPVQTLPPPPQTAAPPQRPVDRPVPLQPIAQEPHFRQPPPQLPPKQVPDNSARQFAHNTFDERAFASKQPQNPSPYQPGQNINSQYIPPQPPVVPNFVHTTAHPVVPHPSDLWPANVAKPAGGSYGMEEIKNTGEISAPATTKAAAAAPEPVSAFTPRPIAQRPVQVTLPNTDSEMTIFGPPQIPQKIVEDETCVLPPDSGNCNNLVPRYFYNAERGECQEFSFGSCGGNANNFIDRRSCEARCGLPAAAKGLPDRCKLPKEEGFGKGYFPTFYFNVKNLRCEQMVFRGTGGNNNQFNTQQECESTCSPTSGSAQVHDRHPEKVTKKPVLEPPVAAKGIANVETEDKYGHSGLPSPVEEISESTGPTPAPYESTAAPPASSPQPPAESPAPAPRPEAPAPAAPVSGTSSSGYGAEPAENNMKPNPNSNLPTIAPSPRGGCNYQTGDCKKGSKSAVAAGVATNFGDKDRDSDLLTQVLAKIDDDSENVLPGITLDEETPTDTGSDSDSEAAVGIPTCPNGLDAMKYSDDRPVMCLPGKNQCPDNSVCYFNGMDFFCCPNADDPYDQHIFGGYDGEEEKHGYKSVPTRLNIKSLRVRRQAIPPSAFSIDSITRPLRFDDKPVQQISRAGSIDQLAALRTNPCIQDVDKGSCKAAHLRYFYDIKSDSCRLFYYSGCDGNANNFASKSDCEQRCKLGTVFEKLPEVEASTPRVPPGRCPGGKMPLGDNAPVLCGQDTDSIGCPSGYYCRSGPPDVCCPDEETADVTDFRTLLAQTEREIRRKPNIHAAGVFDGEHHHHHEHHAHHEEPHHAHGVATEHAVEGGYDADSAGINNAAESIDSIAPAVGGAASSGAPESAGKTAGTPTAASSSEINHEASHPATLDTTTQDSSIFAGLPDTMCPDGSDALLEDDGKPKSCGAGFDGHDLCPKGFYCSMDPARNSRLCCPMSLIGSNIPPPPADAPYFGHRRANPGEVVERGSLPSDPKPSKLSTPKPRSRVMTLEGIDGHADVNDGESTAEFGNDAPGAAAAAGVGGASESSNNVAPVDSASESTGTAQNQVAPAAMPSDNGNEQYAHLMMKPVDRQTKIKQAMAASFKTPDTVADDGHIRVGSMEDPFEMEDGSRPRSKPSVDKSICQLKPTEGRTCREDEPTPRTNLQYYYSMKDKKCKLFFHHGCGGNQNRFDSNTLCERFCRAV